jgi:hypothetical protein
MRELITITDLLGSIFYFGYLIAQWPAGLALQKLPVGKFLAWTTIGMILQHSIYKEFILKKE